MPVHESGVVIPAIAPTPAARLITHKRVLSNEIPVFRACLLAHLCRVGGVVDFVEASTSIFAGKGGLKKERVFILY